MSQFQTRYRRQPVWLNHKADRKNFMKLEKKTPQQQQYLWDRNPSWWWRSLVSEGGAAAGAARRAGAVGAPAPCPRWAAWWAPWRAGAEVEAPRPSASFSPASSLAYRPHRFLRPSCCRPRPTIRLPSRPSHPPVWLMSVQVRVHSHLRFIMRLRFFSMGG